MVRTDRHQPQIPPSERIRDRIANRDLGMEAAD
jgi:hypothetical protein